MPENNGGSMVGGFLLGAVVGAGLALIFAPMPGDETRRHLGQAARKLKQGAGSQLDHVKDAVKGGAHDVQSALEAGRDVFRRSGEKSAATRDQA